MTAGMPVYKVYREQIPALAGTSFLVDAVGNAHVPAHLSPSNRRKGIEDYLSVHLRMVVFTLILLSSLTI